MNTEPYEFLRNCWYVAAWDSEIVGKTLARTITEKPIVIFRTEAGKYVALDDRCCHRAAPLSVGRIEGECIRCMYHGMLYDSNGSCVEVPGQERIPASYKVHSYPIEERGNLLWIWMGEPELADPDLIYDFEPLHQPGIWRRLPKHAYMHYDANYLLIVDNLSDFSHVAFVHTNTLGGSEAYAYNTVPENVERLEDGFNMERWDRNSISPPFHKKVCPDMEAPLDRCNSIQMRFPGVFLMTTSFTPAGWKEGDDPSLTRHYRNCQYMTPETRDSTHFFWDYMHSFNIDQSEISESLGESLLEGFMEDKVIIEKQQKLLKAHPDFDPRILEADDAFMHFRRDLTKTMHAEQEQHPTKPLRIKQRIL